MAIYYLCAQVIGCSAGRSVVAAAAYRSGERLVDQRTGQMHDYTRRREDIETEILAPDQVPQWVNDRGQLWNQVEAAEKRGDAQLARELVIALPIDLSREHQRELIRGYVQEQFVSRGMVADLALHFKEGNPHAHVMLTMREIGPDGFGKKAREWNRSELLVEWREQWARHANGALERAGKDARIDHRSLAEQGQDRMAQVHLGADAAQLERQGVATAKGNHNRLAAEYNTTVIELEVAREHRRLLQQEQLREEQQEARLRAGWHPESVQALATLEHDKGGPITYSETVAIERQTGDALRRVTFQLEQIDAEQWRLERAADALQGRQKEAADVARLETPFAAIKRLFSKQARMEYAWARECLARAERTLARHGVRDAADLTVQRAEWEEKHAPRRPMLAREAVRLSQAYEVATQALAGFDREMERQRARERQNQNRRPERQTVAVLPQRSPRPERVMVTNRLPERGRSRGLDRDR